jgi:hypothetical protein
MGKQLRKVTKRRRRRNYLKRKNELEKQNAAQGAKSPVKKLAAPAAKKTAAKKVAAKKAPAKKAPAKKVAKPAEESAAVIPAEVTEAAPDAAAAE